MCVDFDGIPLCVQLGRFMAQDFIVSIGEDETSSTLFDASMFSYSLQHRNRDLTLDEFETYWRVYSDAEGTDQRELVIWGSGFENAETAWVLGIYIPESTFNSGIGTYSHYDSADALLPNFYVELYSASYDATTGDMTGYWYEALPDSDAASISIDMVCEPCGPDDTVCEDCAFSFDIGWFAVKTRVE
jgi:hypothetical protein